MVSHVETRDFENDGVRVHDVQTCYLCGSIGHPLYRGMRDRLYNAPGVWNLIQCDACGYVWLDPAPLPEEIGKLYRDYYTHAAAPGNSLLAQIKRGVLSVAYGYPSADTRRSACLLFHLLAWVGPLRDTVGGSVLWLEASRRGRLLDVGCGSGEFMAWMRDLGWDVVGLDSDSETVRVAREHYGLDVRLGTIEDLAFPADSFDAVVMSHVIEHVPDPRGTFAECARVLKPGGRIVVATPNHESLGRRRFDEAWLQWDPPRHLQVFSPATLQRCAEDAGLQTVQRRTVARTAYATYVSASLLRQRGRLSGGAWANVPQQRLSIRALAFAIKEALVVKSRNVGEENVLTATKGSGSGIAPHPR